MNAQDAQDAILEAQASVLRWRDDFIADWITPTVLAQLRIAVASLPRDLLERMKAQNPKAYKEAMRVLGIR